MMKRTLLILTVIALSLSCFGQTTLDYFLPEQTTCNTKIPRPSEYTGHEVGEWHITHDKLVGYMKLLAELSDRAVWEEYGKSWEGRPLGNLIISSEKNIRRIEEIREQHLRLSDPRQSAGVDISNMPVIIKLGYGVHGNESSAQNASLVTAYYLVAGEGAEIDRILENAVILIDPALNPDGLQRHSTWVNMYRGMTLTTDPSGREFNEAWPGGRTNHYWFDLNRDYIMLQQPESVGRVAAFFRWMPNINTDHHEMGANSTFFFQPGVQTRNNPGVPKDNQEITALIGNYHARYLDSIGSLYYTEESFDDYYLGKGSAYPDIHGSIGILFEQAGVKGHLREVPSGLLSFPFAIRNHFNVSLSSIEAGVDMRENLLNMQRDFYLSAIREAEASPVKGFIFSTADDPNAGSKFIETLLRHHIDVYQCARALTKNGVDYKPETSYVVPLRQNEYRFIKSLFEPVTTFSDTVFYDISTWVLPMSFNINYFPLSVKDMAGLEGGMITEAPFPKGGVTGNKDAYAWLFEWNDYNSPRALYMIQKEGLTARVATSGFTLTEMGSSRSFRQGTIMVHTGDNGVPADKVREIMEKVSTGCGIEIYGTSTGLTSSGIDLGSNMFIPLEIPSVLLLIDEGIPSDDAGEIWHLLDVHYGMPVTMMPASRLSSTDLTRYNVIIVAGNPQLSQQTLDRIRDWNRAGRTILAYKEGNRWLAANKLAEISFIEGAAIPETTERKYSDRTKDRALFQIPGSIFMTRLDLTHPLCYGYTRPLLPVFKSDAMAVMETGASYNNPVRYTASPLLSGFSAKENTDRLKNSLFVAVHQGGGRIVSIYGDTNFRAIWYGTSKLFANAIFLGQLLRQDSRGDE